VTCYPRNHNFRIKSTDVPRLTQQSRSISPAQVEFCANLNRVHIRSPIYVRLYNESSSNLNSSTMETVRPQRDYPAVCVVAQQYSSATLLSLHYHYRKEKFGAILKTATISIFKLFKIVCRNASYFYDKMKSEYWLTFVLVFKPVIS